LDDRATCGRYCSKGPGMKQCCLMSHHFNPKLLKAAVYGANDGIVTTFAVVAGVAGAGLSANIVLVMGIANMIADGLAMGLGDFLGERSEREMEAEIHAKISKDAVWKSGMVTFISFVIAGSLPLVPYFLFYAGLPIAESSQFNLSIISTIGALFLVGSLRTTFTKQAWWKGGLEMLAIGAIAAGAAYLLGGWVESMIT